MRSLGVRLAFTISGIVFALMVLAGLWLDSQLTKSIKKEAVNQVEVHARTVLASLRVLMLNGKGTFARDWLDQMRQEKGIVDINVLRLDGVEAFTDTSTIDAVNAYIGQQRFSRMPVQVQATNDISFTHFNRATSGVTTIDQHAAGRLTVFMPINMDEACKSCHGYEDASLRGVLSLSLSTASADARISSMRSYLWMVAMILTAVLGTLLWAELQFSVLRPVAKLKDAIRRVGQGERDVRLKLDYKDEFGQVSVAFNNMQSQLVASETRLRTMADSLADAVITTDADGIIETVNPAVQALFGYAPDDLIGQSIVLLLPEPYQKDPDYYFKILLRASRSKASGRRYEFIGLRKDGSTFPMEVSANIMKVNGKRHFVGIVHDITRRKEQLQALEYQALHDALTGLPNRTLLTDRLKQAIRMVGRDSQRLVFMIIDLDHFKEVNDTLGHHYGDVVLEHVATVMRNTVRRSDTVARLGGDEFAVLLPHADIEHARRVADKLQTALSEPFSYDGHQFVTGASIGIVIYPIHGDDSMTLMRHADVAMYAAKRSRGGFAVYDSELDNHSLYNLSLMSGLRQALENDELLLCYQPVINMASAQMSGVEALVRWKHPEHGLLGPDEFIPLAEQTGQIRVLTQWVLKQAVKQCQAWFAQGFDLCVAVNLSVHSLHEEGFPEMVAETLRQQNMDSCKLRLEVTESAIMSRSSQALETLVQLRKAGVKISIDDFGTGYSSLSYLKALPVDEIKIDKSFVMDMCGDENDSAIVHSIIDLAHNMGLSVVAEGVEDVETYDMLADLHCESIQGFYISEPLTADELVNWMEETPWLLGVMREENQTGIVKI